MKQIGRDRFRHGSWLPVVTIRSRSSMGLHSRPSVLTMNMAP